MDPQVRNLQGRVQNLEGQLALLEDKFRRRYELLEALIQTLELDPAKQRNLLNRLRQTIV